MGKDVDIEKGEELGITERTTSAKLLMYYHMSSLDKPRGVDPIIS